MAKQFFVYVMASRRNGTLYVGVTSNLAQRVWHHKEGVVEGFTKKYGVKMLVHCQLYPYRLRPKAVIPAKAGIQCFFNYLKAMAPRLRGGDDLSKLS